MPLITKEDFRQDLDDKLHTKQVSDAEYKRFLSASGIEKYLADPNAVLLIVDLQYDFINGSLAVPGASDTINLIAKLQSDFGADRVFYTEDKHPRDSITFAEIAGVAPFAEWKYTYSEDDTKHTVTRTGWPVHCVDGTPGQEIVIDVLDESHVLSKGLEAETECYSGCKDDKGKEQTFQKGQFAGKTLASVLQGKTVIGCGLAEEYCVGNTLLDLMEEGVQVVFSSNLTAAVNPDSENTIMMREKFNAQVEAGKLELLPRVEVSYEIVNSIFTSFTRFSEENPRLTQLAMATAASVAAIATNAALASRKPNGPM